MRGIETSDFADLLDDLRGVLKEGVDLLCEAKDMEEAAHIHHAHWIDNGNETISCSCCNTWFQKERQPFLLYCGFCGSTMDEKT